MRHDDRSTALEHFRRTLDAGVWDGAHRGDVAELFNIAWHAGFAAGVRHGRTEYVREQEEKRGAHG